MSKINFGDNMKHINIRGTPQPIFSKNLNLPQYNILIVDTVLGEGVSLWSNVNIYGAEIGENTKIGSFVEIGKNVKIGKNCKIESMVFIPEGVTIEDCVFIGPNVVFTNDKFPQACSEDQELKEESNWKITPTTIMKGASIGALSVILCGVTIGENALVGIGSTVVENVPADTIIYGGKAKVRKYFVKHVQVVK